MNKIIFDTLKNPKTGQWSRKNLTGFSCMVYSFFYVTFATMHDKPVQEFVLAIFVGAALTCLGISSWEKTHLPITNKQEEV